MNGEISELLSIIHIIHGTYYHYIPIIRHVFNNREAGIFITPNKTVS